MPLIHSTVTHRLKTKRNHHTQPKQENGITSKGLRDGCLQLLGSVAKSLEKLCQSIWCHYCHAKNKQYYTFTIIKRFAFTLLSDDCVLGVQHCVHSTPFSAQALFCETELILKITFFLFLFFLIFFSFPPKPGVLGTFTLRSHSNCITPLVAAHVRLMHCSMLNWFLMSFPESITQT